MVVMYHIQKSHSVNIGDFNSSRKGKLHSITHQMCSKIALTDIVHQYITSSSTLKKRIQSQCICNMSTEEPELA